MRYNHYMSQRKKKLTWVLKQRRYWNTQNHCNLIPHQRGCNKIVRKVTLHTTKFTRLKAPISIVATILLKILMIFDSPVCKAVCTKSGPKKLPPIPTATTSVSTLPVAPTCMEVQRERSAEKKLVFIFIFIFYTPPWCIKTLVLTRWPPSQALRKDTPLFHQFKIWFELGSLWHHVLPNPRPSPSESTEIGFSRFILNPYNSLTLKRPRSPEWTFQLLIMYSRATFVYFAPFLPTKTLSQIIHYTCYNFSVDLIYMLEMRTSTNKPNK